MRSLSNMASRKHDAARAREARFEALLDGHGTTARLARALSMSPSQLHRVWAGKTLKQPGYLIAIAELLEALPEDQWPERWRT